MATKSKQESAEAETSHVTRIKASDSGSVKKEKVVKQPKEKPIKVAKEGKRNIFVALGGYFKGAWFELREVRWPTRKATWSLTFAVLAFTAFFGVLILLLDALYKFLFEIILK